MEDNIIPLEGLDFGTQSIIKVMGVGGGGGNAINYMYEQGIQDVTFLICNTDRQALSSSPIPAKLQLGKGLGAGGNPEVAHRQAEESEEKIREALDDGTEMLFLTAGMGGGTGTGASSVIAKIAQDMGILTIGIVTIPFKFEGLLQINKALKGLAELQQYTDALLIINNEKLTTIYPDLDLPNAFIKSNEVLCNAAKSIAEIITVPGYINTDFQDVYNTLKDGGVAIMNVGEAEGDQRITKAIENALNSPLVNTTDVHGASRILLNLYCSTENAIKMNEIEEISRWRESVGETVDVKWGASYDNTLGNKVRITLVATGYSVNDIPGLGQGAKKEEVTEAPGETPKITIDDFRRKAYEEPSQTSSLDEEVVSESPIKSTNQIEEPTDWEEEETYQDEQKQIIVFGEEDFNAQKTEQVVDYDALMTDDDYASQFENIPSWKRKRK